MRYLWIDSLCIIQDDHDDWETESPRMSQVYLNSYLTVAASSSKSSSEGCFPLFRSRSYVSMDGVCSGEAVPKRNPLEFVKADFVLTVDDAYCRLYFAKEWMRASSKAQPMVYWIGTFGKSFDPIATEYLSSRAWTLQERLLSPRILHYGQEQMFWECKQCFSAEDGTLFNPGISSIDNVLIFGQLLAITLINIPTSLAFLLLEASTIKIFPLVFSMIIASNAHRCAWSRPLTW